MYSKNIIWFHGSPDGLKKRNNGIMLDNDKLTWWLGLGENDMAIKKPVDVEGGGGDGLAGVWFCCWIKK